MPRELYEVVLKPDEMKELMSVTHKGSGHSARVIMHANVLLKTNDGDFKRKKTDFQLKMHG